MKTSSLKIDQRMYSLVESTILNALFNMAETLSPFVYWGQTSDVVFLKIALRNTEVSGMFGSYDSASWLSVYLKLKFGFVFVFNVSTLQCESRWIASSARRSEISGFHARSLFSIPQWLHSRRHEQTQPGYSHNCWAVFSGRSHCFDYSATLCPSSKANTRHILLSKYFKAALSFTHINLNSVCVCVCEHLAHSYVWTRVDEYQHIYASCFSVKLVTVSVLMYIMCVVLYSMFWAKG